ncbi:hypothetical protein KBY96_15470 [Cyanobium sp. ATX 6A2]|uniref:hypothetical protein n=1 Tax=Cyanobium sp. ATX 6A2 TaxID=2823700 RepID=UPI0020CBEE25|nr:hypothetical protein [Cyanobium sp. ATX 6A2]MCP9889315.1 hypothetical protein [Cyanobium sp. ATX 6A2]
MAAEVLVRSRERLLAGLQAAAPGSGVLFRCGRDGPIRHRARAGAVGCDHEYLAAGCD